jgi:hypothetical protein
MASTILIVRRVFGRDAGMIIMSFIQIPMKEIKCRQLQVVYNIFNYENNSDRVYPTPFEICQNYSQFNRKIYFGDKSWIRCVNQILDFNMAVRDHVTATDLHIRGNYTAHYAREEAEKELINQRFHRAIRYALENATRFNDRWG